MEKPEEATRLTHDEVLVALGDYAKCEDKGRRLVESYEDSEARLKAARTLADDPSFRVVAERAREAFFQCLICGEGELVEEFLNAGMSPDVRSEGGAALDYALMAGDRRMVRLLKRHGAEDSRTIGEKLKGRWIDVRVWWMLNVLRRNSMKKKPDA